MTLDKTQIAALVLAVVVSILVGLFGARTIVGYVTCHERIESIGLGLTPAYDPITNVCTVRL